MEGKESRLNEVKGGVNRSVELGGEEKVRDGMEGEEEGEGEGDMSIVWGGGLD